MDYVVDNYRAPDGARYTGTLKNGLPNGLGTCTWPNGSQYDGEWRNGLMHGFGTYVWPTGQRYDGEWKDGKRDGIGIKTYEDGSMYDGFWQDGKKHGLGVYRPPPPDDASRRQSIGTWQMQPAAGQQQQQPSQQQPSQQQQEGDKGTAAAEAAVEASGSPAAASDTSSRTALGPAAAGCLQAAEGLNHVPSSGDIMKLSQPGAYPGPSRLAVRTSGGDAIGGGSPPGPLSPPGATAAAGARSPAPPPPPPLADALAPLLAASSAGGAPAAALRLLIREYDDGALLREDALSAEEIKMIFGFLWPKRQKKVRQRALRALGRKGPRLQLKMGEVVYKGHYSYELMSQLQLGIRYSVGHTSVRRPSAPSGGSGAGRATSKQQQQQQHGQVLPGEPPLGPEDFEGKLKVSFPSCGSCTTPAHPCVDFKWKDYAPRVFKRLRAAAGIDEADYMLSLGGSTALRQLNSPGKSGSVFFLSDDERFLVKTMRKSEAKVLLGMLPTYFAHVQAHPHTLITRFFGVHRITPAHGRAVRFVVMANIFVTDLQIHRRFDIKGSTEGRTVGEDAKKRAEGDPSVIFKDLDIDFKLQLDPGMHNILMTQLRADADLLRACGVMDYSLLLGIHYPNRALPRASIDATLSTDIPQSALATMAAALSPHDSAWGAAGSSDAHAGAGDATPLTLDGRTGSGLLSPGSASSQQAGLGQQQQQAAAPGPGSSPAPDHLTRAPLPPLRPLVLPRGYSLGDGAAAAAAPGATSAAGAAPRDDVAAPPPGVLLQTTGLSVGGDRARNFDVRSNAVEVEGKLARIVERMQALGFSEQRQKDIAELARLKILGGKLKKRSTARKEPPSAVLSAAQQVRQETFAAGSADGTLAAAAAAAAAGTLLSCGGGVGADSMGGAASAAPHANALSTSGASTPWAGTGGGSVPASSSGGGGWGAGPLPPTPVRHALTHAGGGAAHLAHLSSLRGAFTGLPFDEEDEVAETPLAGATAADASLRGGLLSAGGGGVLGGGWQLGINVPALALPDDPRERAEEVVVCFGIIDILQDYSVRKVLERQVKSITHDRGSISVAPPRWYSTRFLDFITTRVFAGSAGYGSGGGASIPTGYALAAGGGYASAGTTGGGSAAFGSPIAAGLGPFGCARIATRRSPEELERGLAEPLSPGAAAAAAAAAAATLYERPGGGSSEGEDEEEGDEEDGQDTDTGVTEEEECPCDPETLLATDPLAQRHASATNVLRAAGSGKLGSGGGSCADGGPAPPLITMSVASDDGTPTRIAAVTV